MLLFVFLWWCVLGDVYSVKLLNVSVEEFGRENGLKHVRSVLGYEVFESSHAKRTIPIGAFRDVQKRHFKRARKATETDPLFYSQWHLQMVRGQDVATDGGGVQIAIVDDGVQHVHEDLKQNYNGQLSWDFNGKDADPTPAANDGHGTACAGVAAAVRNHVCGRGVAPGAGIVGLRLIGGLVYDYEEGMAFSHHSDRIRIYSNSWGPEDNGISMDAPGPVALEALKRGFERGNLFVWAGGNGRRQGDNSNCDGYANSRYTLAIGANDYTGQASYYSEPGANLLAVTPSSGSGRGIVTTDLLGPDGYNQGMCTGDFGGTSSAAPLAAGIFALMLSVRPELNARDITHIVAKMGDFKHSHDTGFGMLVIPRLLEFTRQHVVLQPRAWISVSATLRVAQSITKGYDGLSIPFTPTRDLIVEKVVVTIDFSHGSRGQVVINLVSPLSTSYLLPHRASDRTSGRFVWSFSSLHHYGETLSPTAAWHVVVRDDTFNEYHGTVNHVTVEWLGH
jgi:kexin